MRSQQQRAQADSCASPTDPVGAASASKPRRRRRRQVREALSLAYDAHAGQRRKSGEPFITHPVEVTRILAELKMDYECLVAGG